MWFFSNGSKFIMFTSLYGRYTVDAVWNMNNQPIIMPIFTFSSLKDPHKNICPNVWRQCPDKYELMLYFFLITRISVSFLQGQYVWSGNIHVCGFYIQQQGPSEIFRFFCLASVDKFFTYFDLFWHKVYID